MIRINKIIALTALLVALLPYAPNSAVAEIIIQRTPDEGVQPRLVTDTDGGIHLLYFKKRINSPAAREGNLYYRQYDPEQGSFGLPLKVSSQAFAMQTFSIARASMAIGADGRLHVMWYLPRESRFNYSRSNPQRSQFEPLRSMVSQYAEGIDAGGEVAARGSQVAIIWGAGALSREYERTMFARFSQDSGATFGEEMMISNPDLGACACCSMAAEYLNDEDLLVAYRSAIDGIGRHMQLLTVSGVDGDMTGASYGALHELQQWEASFCPLSTNDIASASSEEQWLVFETESRIMQLKLSETSDPSRVGEPFSETRQKNPAIALNKDGQRLIAWGEAISHARGGRLNLKVFDEFGNDTGYQLPKEITIDDYSFPAAAGLPNGDFLVLY
ncbi:MAG: hypothetical protein O2971_07500 [Proteobacteria bacterium]|nr:hypothetical protein [Pseudomonadota bacterium]